MNVRLRDHRRQERDVVDTGRQVRQQVADPVAALAVLPPFPGAGHDGARLALEQLDLAAGIELPAVSLDERGFVVERVALAGRARHEELHDPGGAGTVMQAAVPLRARALRSSLRLRRPVPRRSPGGGPAPGHRSRRRCATGSRGDPERASAASAGSGRRHGCGSRYGRRARTWRAWPTGESGFGVLCSALPACAGGSTRMALSMRLSWRSVR